MPTRHRWQITDALRLDAGLRYQHTDVRSLDTLFQVANEFDSVTLPSSRYRFTGSALSWTAGAQYSVTPQLSAWSRYSLGHYLPTFGDLFNGVNAANTFSIDTARVSSIEGG